MYALGIDLGTTFTAAAVWREGRAEIASLGSRSAAIPSVVVLREDDTIITGESASRRAHSSPHRVAREFKRRLGDTTPILLAGVPYSAEALMARMLRAVVEEVSAREGGPPAAVTVSHPANWGPYKTDLLQQAVRTADLNHVTFTTEPVAAAVCYAVQERLPDGAIVAVYDLGGGTFDAAVLRREETGFVILGRPEGIERLGGIDFDAAVFGHVARSLNGALESLDEDDPASVIAVARLREECTAAKEALSADTDTTIPVLLPSLSTEVRLTRGELETMVRPALQETVDAMRRALRSADVTAADLHSVLLVGGSSRMPIVAQLVGAELSRPVAVDVHPKHAVALGAAWVASGMSGGRAVEGSAVPAVDAALAVGAVGAVAAVSAVGATPAVGAVSGTAPVTAGALAAMGAASRAADAGPQTMVMPPATFGPAGGSVNGSANGSSGGSGGHQWSGPPGAGGADVEQIETDRRPAPPPGRYPFPGVGDDRSPAGLGRPLRIAGVAVLVVAMMLVGAVLVALKHDGGATALAAATTPANTSPALAAATSAGAPGPLAVVAHRGGYETFPRESLPALLDAAKAGDIAQADVLFTADDVPILIRETTTVDPSKADKLQPMVCTGGPYEIAKTKWAVLQSHCRSLASASQDGRRYPIATLDQALAALAAVKGAWFYPEISATNSTPAQTAAVLASIEKHGMLNRTVVGSFFPDALQQIRAQALAARGARLPIMLYLPPTSGGMPSTATVIAEHLYGVTIQIKSATKEYVDSLKKAHLIVMAWNLNQDSQWAAAKELGVQDVFTDTPAAYRLWAARVPTPAATRARVPVNLPTSRTSPSLSVPPTTAIATTTVTPPPTSASISTTSTGVSTGTSTGTSTDTSTDSSTGSSTDGSSDTSTGASPNTSTDPSSTDSSTSALTAGYPRGPA